MTNDAEMLIWQIEAVQENKKTPVPLSLESFFMAKMGRSAGKQLYKDLLISVSQLGSGPVAVDLAEKHGPFVTYRSST